MNIFTYLKQEEVKALLWAQRHLVGALILAFLAGLFVSGLWGALERYEQSKLEKLLVISEKEQRRLLNQAAELTLTTERLRATNQALTESISEQELENRELNRGLDFYRQLMDPQKVQKGLVLQHYSIDPINPQIYRLRFTFVQYALKHSLMRAELSFSLKGTLNGKATVLSFSALKQDIPTASTPNAKLSFRYFQEMEQVIQVPEDFDVEKVLLSAKLRGKKAKRWQQELDWPFTPTAEAVAPSEELNDERNNEPNETLNEEPDQEHNEAPETHIEQNNENSAKHH